MLAACSAEPEAPVDQPDPSPLLYEVRSDTGEVEAWLFGTIHALPDDFEWRTPALEAASEKSDLLVVEIADLNNRAGIANEFARLSRRADGKPILDRVEPARRSALLRLMMRADFDEDALDTVDTWAVALMLARLTSSGESVNGVDRAMIEEFVDRPIREFEGAEKQLGIFDSLPEKEQRDLLLAVMDDLEGAAGEPAKLRNAWVAGDEHTLTEATQTGIMADPELREALLIKRNNDWMAQLGSILAGDTIPMVAVGAGHLVGPDGLPVLLAAQGYVVERIQ